MMKILALIPAYNESGRVTDVVRATQAFLPVLVVDDGSVDDTAARAEATGAAVLRQSPNQGKGAALRAGFLQALEQNYEGVLTLDADGQHDPTEIPKFLDAYTERKADLIVGARDFDQIPAIRRAANTLGRWSFSSALGQPVLDNQSGYRLISRRLMEATLSSGEGGFEFEVEMIAICVRCGFGLASVPIRTIYRGETSHINNFSHLVHFLRMAWKTRSTRRK